MAEYIDRNAFIQRYRALYCMDCISRQGYKNGKLVTLYKIGEAPCRSCREDNVLCALEDYPAADVVEVLHGKWSDTATSLYRKCSECGCCVEWDKLPFLFGKGKYNYCPNCGSKMDGEDCDEKSL